jgi:hypothetical protein
MFQASLPLYEKFLTVSSELSSQLQSTATVFSSFIDTAQRLADSANSTKGDIDECKHNGNYNHRLQY